MHLHRIKKPRLHFKIVHVDTKKKESTFIFFEEKGKNDCCYQKTTLNYRHACSFFGGLITV